METKHTAGPWTYSRMLLPPRVEDRRSGFVVNGPDRDPLDLPIRICDLRVPRGVAGFAEGEANAKLIAAAPALLEALEGLFEHCAMVHKHWGEGSNQREADAAIDAARAAIAQAAGELATA
jgi:hypothetical protein